MNTSKNKKGKDLKWLKSKQLEKGKGKGKISDPENCCREDFIEQYPPNSLRVRGVGHTNQHPTCHYLYFLYKS